MFEYENQVVLNHGRVVKRGETELQFFTDEKNANAWILHTFGLQYISEAKSLGLTVKSFAKRGPRYGDSVSYVGADDYYKGKTGILEGVYGDGTFGICFNASAFRINDHISCFGGPIPCIDKDSLTFAGLKDVVFWRWHTGYGGAYQGGYYYMTVPHWVWAGAESKS